MATLKVNSRRANDLSSAPGTNPTISTRVRLIGLDSAICAVIAVAIGFSAYLVKPETESLAQLNPRFSLFYQGPELTALTFKEWHRSGNTEDAKEVLVSISAAFKTRIEQRRETIIGVPIADPATQISGCNIRDHEPEIQDYPPDFSLKSICYINERRHEPGTNAPLALAKATMEPDSSTFAAEFLFVNTAGVGFKATDSRIEVHFPAFGGFVSADPVEMTIEYQTADINKYAWSGTSPTSYQFRTNDIAIWKYSVTNSLQGPLPASGTRQDMATTRSERTFLAGVLLGTAGSALIAAVQTVLARLSRRGNLHL